MAGFNARVLQFPGVLGSSEKSLFDGESFASGSRPVTRTRKVSMLKMIGAEAKGRLWDELNHDDGRLGSTESQAAAVVHTDRRLEAIMLSDLEP